METLKHPTKAQVQTVIDNFKKVRPMAKREDHLDMGESSVNTRGHQCGTVHCHGGWYAVAVLDNNVSMIYAHGAEAMAQHLGFDDEIDLEFWADENPDVWGNDSGTRMFTNAIAFSDHGKGPARNLDDIIEHWERVRDRLPE